MFAQAFAKYGKLIENGKVVSLNGGLKVEEDNENTGTSREFLVKIAVNILQENH